MLMEYLYKNIVAITKPLELFCRVPCSWAQNNSGSLANMKGGQHEIAQLNPDKCRELVEQKKTIFIVEIGQKYSYATRHSTHWRYYWQPDDNNFWKQKEKNSILLSIK